MSQTDRRYVAWIANYLTGKKFVLGLCKSAVEEMVKAFPELIAVPGHVYVPRWGKRGHWWCKTQDGQIIDPTASQFPHISAYEPWNPGDEVLVSKCMECGDEIWKPLLSVDDEPKRQTFCDIVIVDGIEQKNCERAFCVAEGFDYTERKPNEKATPGKTTDGDREGPSADH